MASGPLNGIRVLEFGQVIAAPLACQFLSDLGAEVIKVEPPEGEPWRFNQAFMPGESKAFQEVNHGKLSIAVDLASAAGREVVYRLLPEIDVVVINYRPDIAANLGIDYESLSAIRPDLVYADVTAFGREGHMSDRPGYDLVVQAASGMLGTLGVVNAHGVPPVPAPPISDTTTAYSIATGVCAALFHRAMTGEGQKIETSLLVNSLAVQLGGSYSLQSVPAGDAHLKERLADAHRRYRAENQTFAQLTAAREGVIRPSKGNIYYRCYETSDGVIAVAALSRSLREKVRSVLDVQHSFDQPGYDPSDPEQRQIDEALTTLVEQQIRKNSTAHWEQAFSSGGVPVSPVNFAQEMLDHPQVEANGYVTELEHDLSGPYRVVSPPWKMSATPPLAQGASPPLGRDTYLILSRAGYTEEEIGALRNAGTVTG